MWRRSAVIAVSKGPASAPMGSPRSRPAANSSIPESISWCSFVSACARLESAISPPKIRVARCWEKLYGALSPPRRLGIRLPSPSCVAAGSGITASATAQLADSGGMSTDALIAVITGANKGLGYFTGEGLARRGYRIILVGRRHDRLVAAQETLRARVPGVRTGIAVADFSEL